VNLVLTVEAWFTINCHQILHKQQTTLVTFIVAPCIIESVQYIVHSPTNALFIKLGKV